MVRLRSVIAIVAIVPISLAGCGSDDETPDVPAEVETEIDGEQLPEGDFVDPALVDENEDDLPDDPGDAPDEAPPAGD